MSAEEQPVRRAAVWALIVLGWAWLALAGGCTLFFFGSSVWGLIQANLRPAAASETRNTASLGSVVLVASVIVGGAGVLIGWLILSAGRALRQGRRRVGVGWLLVAVGGAWTVLTAGQMLSALILLPTFSQTSLSIPGLAMSLLFGLANILPPATLLAAGFLILRGPRRRD